MILRLPRFAEVKFAELCAVEGALCHRAEEDESGWDYHVEFPPATSAGPADTHPPRKKAYVQVKSKEEEPPGCRVKLSNALIAAQSPQPWFVVLAIPDATGTSTRIFAVHVWEELIRRTLKAVRIAENQKKALNRRDLTISFQHEDEHSTDLVSWMQETIEAVEDYEQQKKHIYQTTGYEEGYGIAHVTFTTSTWDEALDNLLGLGSGLALSRFVYTQSRFGIRSPEPDLNITSGVLHVTPKPVSTCEIRLRSPRSLVPMVLPGQVYSPGIADLPLERSRLRFSSALLELTWSPGGKSQCTAHFDCNAKQNLPLIEHFSTLMEWRDAGPLDVQVWSGGQRALGGTLELNRTEWNVDWQKLSKIVKLLRFLSGSVEESEIQLSVADIDTCAWELLALQELAEARSLRLEFEHSPQTPLEFTCLLYYFYADVMGWTFYALSKRPITEDIVIQERRRVTCGRAQMLEGYVLREPSEGDRKCMEDDYQRHLRREEDVATPLGIGDIHSLIETRHQ